MRISFYEALNQNRGENGYCPKLHCRIPFLSGGLFEPIDGYAWKENNFAIPNEVFSNAREKGLQADGILDIFDRYNFTMSEDEPMEREVAIDPEMLGKVFENLLEIQDRKSKGAFYTPREIVHYMCQESLIAYLVRETGVSETAIRDFILYGDFMKDEDTVKTKREGNGGMYISEELFLIDDRGEIAIDRLKDVDKALATIRVADPAVGSGAFPLGMLNEIVRARQNITAYMAIPMNSYDRRYMYQTLRSPYALKYETINKLISAPYAVAARKMMAESQVNEIRDYSSVNVFKSAAVYPVVFRVTKVDVHTPVVMNVMRDMMQIETQNVVEVDTFYSDVNWDKYFTSAAGALDIITKMSVHPELQKIASVNGAATVSEAYLVKEFMLDMPEAGVEYKRFINTGGIDPYKSFYGKEFIRYLKGKYMYPVVPVSELESMSHKRMLESNAPKIIIGGMTKILECYYDAGMYLAGKSTTIVYGNAHLRYLTAVLNSRLMTFYYQVYFNSMSLAGGFYRIGAPQIKTLPILCRLQPG